MSGYGQMESKKQLMAGHDINYLALSGILSKFKRTGVKSAPVFPANLLADFASASLYGFNLVLQALIVKKSNTVLDCSIFHSTVYLSQPELLEAVKVGINDRFKDKNKIPLVHFTRPHECIYKDKNGVCFVLKPGSKIYEMSYLQHYMSEDQDSSKMYSDMHQIVFESMTIDEIIKEYGAVEVMKTFDEVL